jgi:uncharacterized membrane protein HdeD (DUF308 family)
MTEQAKSIVLSSAPWRKGIPWPIVLLEGIGFAVLGIYMLSANSAQDVVRQLVAIILLVNGIIEILGGFRADDSGGARYRVLRGAIGATVGLIIALDPFFNYLDGNGARGILGLGFLAFAIVGLALLVITREESGIRIGAIVINLAFLVLGILFLTGDEEDSSRIDLLGTIAIILGVLLVLYALYLYRTTQSQASSTPTGTASSTSTTG